MKASQEKKRFGTEQHREEFVSQNIYFTHKQSYIHTNIHTVLHSYKYISVYLIFFPFIIKSNLLYYYFVLLCYTVRASSLLKSMHVLLVVSRASVCK